MTDLRPRSTNDSRWIYRSGMGPGLRPAREEQTRSAPCPCQTLPLCTPPPQLREAVRRTLMAAARSVTAGVVGLFSKRSSGIRRDLLDMVREASGGITY
ncbi:hypothetical protein JZ751_013202 [Albula glossodonta]|uniref:Uncharacterized protein n=1 Tax=Albula glossodonta TaxID=121402 RepID=A0A8T2NXH3_9TELE|nr:hypothetical protein JZ751_013202 [Albula glossodonta]